MTNTEILEALKSGAMTLKKTGKFYTLNGTPTDKLLTALKHRKTWSMQIDERIAFEEGDCEECRQAVAFWKDQRDEFHRIMDEVNWLTSMLAALDPSSIWNMIPPEFEPFVRRDTRAKSVEAGSGT